MHKSQLLHHQAHLWIGSPSFTQQQLIAQLQKILCPQQGCQTCSTCTLIAQQQHPWVYWFAPENSYTMEQIDEILSLVKFKLHNHEQRFLIFTQANELTASSNNRLLKTIEEPNAGYYFIFLTNRTDNILPTLISRCFVKELSAQHEISNEYAEILQPFLQAIFDKPLEFIKLIDKFEIKERETRDIIDHLLIKLHQKLQLLHRQQPNNVAAMLQITDQIVLLKQALTQLPMPGSAKLFWKNLYLTFHQQQLCNKKSSNPALNI